MLKRATVLLLVVLLASYAAPVSAQTLTQEDWTARFTAELNDYASTHSEAETRAYAQYRLDQLTYSNFIPETTQTNLLEPGISPEVLYGEYTTSTYLDLDYDFNRSSKLSECTFRRQEQCRSAYNSDVLTSAAISTGIFAGCNAITALSGFLICTAAALAAHMLMIQAARERYQTCINNSAWECRKELGLL
jgi:hypothetical protein